MLRHATKRSGRTSSAPCRPISRRRSHAQRAQVDSGTAVSLFPRLANVG
jgi:hypothetical protein